MARPKMITEYDLFNDLLESAELLLAEMYPDIAKADWTARFHNVSGTGLTISYYETESKAKEDIPFYTLTLELE